MPPNASTPACAASSHAHPQRDRHRLRARVPCALAPLPPSHPKTISAIPHCRSGHDGHSLSQCHSGGTQHRVQHSCGNRHCPQCQQHTPQLWLPHQLEQPLPGPHCLVPFPVPETLRPGIRSHQRMASQAMVKASAHALTRLAKDERFSGTPRPGCPGLLPTWGRQLQYHPHLHSIVPGGGLSTARAAWLPSRANFFVPVKALSPIDRAIFKQEMPHAALLTHIAPLVWPTTWNGHRQANPNGHPSCTYLAPYVFTVALATSRIVCLQERTVPFTSRKPGRARPRTTTLDAMAFLRRFLQHVVPDGFMKVRHCGFMHARSAIHTHPLRQMISLTIGATGQPAPPHIDPPSTFACPDCGGPLRVVTRVFPCQTACFATG